MITADIIIGHNISFDKKMIMVECYRNKVEQNFTKNGRKLQEFCTMKNSINLCKIIAHDKYGREYFKYPKLMELHKHLFGDIPEGLHNSMVDVLVCLRCYGKMKFDTDLNSISTSLTMLNNIY